MHTKKKESLKDLQRIPGVGISLSEDLWNIGITCVEDLKGQNPERLYKDICLFQKAQVDRCVLYVFRCAVYFAEEPNPKQELLKWWNWKDT